LASGKVYVIDWQAMQLTVELAVIVAGCLLVIGLPVAYWLTYSRWRAKFLIEALVGLPLILPPTVLGFYLLIAFGSHSAFGRWWQSLTGHPLAFSFTGLVVGSIIYSFPFAVQPFAASFAAVDRDLLSASAILGASRWRTFWRVVLPLSFPGVLTGIVLSFAHTVGEFGVVLMIGGNIPGVTRTISIDIYDRVQGGEYAAANHTSVILLLFSFVVLALVYGVNRRFSVVYPFEEAR
jgi:molybdate transport system permease protein